MVSVMPNPALLISCAAPMRVECPVGVFTVRRAEQPGGDEAMRQGTARKITEALEAGGVRLTESGGIEPRAK